MYKKKFLRTLVRASLAFLPVWGADFPETQPRRVAFVIRGDPAMVRVFSSHPSQTWTYAMLMIPTTTERPEPEEVVMGTVIPTVLLNLDTLRFDYEMEYVHEIKVSGQERAEFLSGLMSKLTTHAVAFKLTLPENVCILTSEVLYPESIVPYLTRSMPVPMKELV